MEELLELFSINHIYYDISIDSADIHIKLSMDKYFNPNTNLVFYYNDILPNMNVEKYKPIIENIHRCQIVFNKISEIFDIKYIKPNRHYLIENTIIINFITQYVNNIKMEFEPTLIIEYVINTIYT